MKVSGNMGLMITLKVTKMQGFTLSLQNTFLETPQGGVKLTPTFFKVKHYARKSSSGILLQFTHLFNFTFFMY